MFEALTDALGLVFTLKHLAFLGVGVLLGLIVGVFPGLGGIAGLSVLLAFLYPFQDDPVAGLALMVGLVAVIPTSDTFSSVLMGIPGSSASQATVLDGFPLSRQGQAARALSAAFVSSLYGGLIGAALLTFFILLAVPLIRSFKTPEMLAVTVLGFSMVSVLSGRSLFKGVVAAGLGALVGAVGEGPTGWGSRMSFGSEYLSDGFQLVGVGLGVFAIPEIISLLRTDRSISDRDLLGHGWRQGVLDWWRNIFLSTRCAVIGVIVGVIPGLGGSVVDWIAYGHTVQSSRDQKMFGNGEIRGVIGPESSNNAKEGGGLVPTLVFGIPGSGSMAVFLGGMGILGIEEGITFVTTRLDTTYTIAWSLALANVLGAGLCLLLSPLIARLTRVRFTLLAPFMLMVICFAAFQPRESLADLMAMLGIGILGILMKRFGWSRPAFLIGFVLSSQAETYTYQVVQFTQRLGVSYLLSPLVLVILAVTIVSVWLSARKKPAARAAGAHELSTSGTVPAIRTRKLQAGFSLSIVVFSAAMLMDSFRIPVLLDKIFPIAVALVTLPFALLISYLQIRGHDRRPELVDEEPTAETGGRGLVTTLAWMAGLVVLTALTGFFIANFLFFIAFLIRRDRMPWIMALPCACSASSVLWMFSWLSNCDFPRGLLQNLVDMPWPLG